MGSLPNLIDMCVQVRSLHTSPTLGNPMDCSLPVSLVHRISQARILEWVAMPSTRGLPDPEVRDRTHVSCGSYIEGRFFFIAGPPGKPAIDTKGTNIWISQTLGKEGIFTVQMIYFF